MNRLEERVAELLRRGERGLVPFVTAGDGGLDTTLAVVRALDSAGATCVELGVPFSDPIADGPVLQAAAQRALSDGTTWDGVLALVRRLRAGERGAPPSALPVAVFTYANPLARHGWEAALHSLAEAGADALLVPDLPVEEGRALFTAARAQGLAPIAFAAPTTRAERLQHAARESRGFLYAIPRAGVTGARTDLACSGPFLAAVRAACSAVPHALAAAVGFGIATRAQVEAVHEHADLAIVGSALVERIHAARASGTPAAAARAAASYLNELAGRQVETS